MKSERKPQMLPVLPVLRSKREAKQSYDCMSRLYDYLTRPFEGKYADIALQRLSVQQGETVLEIGFGPGHCLKQTTQAVGDTGKAYGIDISSGMLEVAKRRLEKAGLIDRVELYCGDAMKLPYDDGMFDAVFMSFTLELFDTPEISEVLKEIRRVLKPIGRLGVVSMSRSYGGSIALGLYEWSHKKLPKYVDCRPIYVERSLRDARFTIQIKEKALLVGLPLEIIIATNVA